jgi:hypothetical protein
MPGFFDAYPKFFETSHTGSSAARLNYRYDLMIEQNRPLLAGKTVLDIASHDGRWSFAALKGAGAKHATGIEARKQLVDAANETFPHYGIARGNFEFIRGDAHRQLAALVRQGRRFDTVLLLGFFYHTIRHWEMVQWIAGLGASAIVIDTGVALIGDPAMPVIQLRVEANARMGSLVSGNKPADLVGVPSAAAVRLILQTAGYQTYTAKLAIPAAAKGPCWDYDQGRRLTIVGVRGEALAAEKAAGRQMDKRVPAWAPAAAPQELQEAATRQTVGGRPKPPAAKIR